MPDKKILQEFRQLHKHLSPFLTPDQNRLMEQMSGATTKKINPVPTHSFKKLTHQERVAKHLKLN